jgi:hypothetical protein
MMELVTILVMMMELVTMLVMVMVLVTMLVMRIVLVTMLVMVMVLQCVVSAQNSLSYPLPALLLLLLPLARKPPRHVLLADLEFLCRTQARARGWG